MCNTISRIRFGVALYWYGFAVYGVVWYGFAVYGVVWYGFAVLYGGIAIHGIMVWCGDMVSWCGTKLRHGMVVCLNGLE